MRMSQKSRNDFGDIFYLFVDVKRSARNAGLARPFRRGMSRGVLGKVYFSPPGKRADLKHQQVIIPFESASFLFVNYLLIW
jgi:hypothetical protein